MPGKIPQDFEVMIGIDMETDIGSFTPFYDGVKHGTGELLSVMKKNALRSAFSRQEMTEQGLPIITSCVHSTGRAF